MTTLKNNQHSRNRAIVKEIIETCAEFRNTIKTVFDKMRDEYDQE